MWLIDTGTLKLVEFQGPPPQSYAILSHTWGPNAEELTFDEFKAGTGDHKIGYKKIKACCEQAQKDKLHYAWVDTCCIDKKSTVELSEAINSMFEWYARAKMCYVYLADVSDPLIVPGKPPPFAKSRWFTRGWTLQELIAPKHVSFFTQDWVWIGDKSNLCQDMQIITGIPADVLRFRKDFLDCSLAQRMFWASKRETTRVEDSAYCLIGLFNISMPLLYGEGSKAFLRLQEIIVQQTDDETIFAWTGVDPGGSGLLAPAASYFAECARVERDERDRKRQPYAKTNRGWSIECQMIPWAINTYLVPLRCTQNTLESRDLTELKGRTVAIFMCRTSNDDQYRRISFQGKCTDTITDQELSGAMTVQVLVPDDVRTAKLAHHSYLPWIKVQSNMQWSLVPEKSEIASKVKQHDAKKTADTYYTLVQFQPEHLSTGIAIAFDKPAVLGMRRYYHLHIGFDPKFNPVCVLRCGRLKWTSYFSSSYWRVHPGSSNNIIGKVLYLIGAISNREPLLEPPSKFTSLQTENSLLMFLNDVIVSASQGDRNKGLDETIRHRLPLQAIVRRHLPLEFGCVEIRIKFYPQGSGFWYLWLEERSPHPGYHCYGLFCARGYLQVWEALTFLSIYSWRLVFPHWAILSLYENVRTGSITVSKLTPGDLLEKLIHFSVVLLFSDRISSLFLPASIGVARARFATPVLLAVLLWLLRT